MSLVLSLENIDRLDNGEPVTLKLDRHGAIIGRSPHSDWSLPDPKNYISSSHCEIDYRGGAYLLFDKSTNGTYVNDASMRLDGPHVLKDGDLITIGHYKIRVQAAGGLKSTPPPPTPKSGGWDGWGDGGDASSVAPSSSAWDAPAPIAPPAPQPAAPAAYSSGGGWADPPVAPAASGWGAEPAASAAAAGWPAAPPGPPPPPPPSPASAWPTPAANGGWDSPPPSTPRAPVGDAWGAVSPPGPAASGWDEIRPAQAPAAAQVDDWGRGSAISGRGSLSENWTPPQVQAPAAAEPADVWGAFAASNEVDWRRGGFGDPAPAPAAPPAVPAAATFAPAPAPPASPASDAAWAALLRAGGVDGANLKVSPTEAAETAGLMLRRLLAGLVVMMEARARAKAQLGAQSTTLELNGNNPLKFTRRADRVLEQLLNPPERGFMGTEQAIEDSFQDLQAHQMATLAAMQGALAATLARFSPEAIRQRAESRGVLAKILPAARDAELWNAYAREFEGVAKGSDEAFMDVFAKEFKQAYERAADNLKKR